MLNVQVECRVVLTGGNRVAVPVGHQLVPDTNKGKSNDVIERGEL